MPLYSPIIRGFVFGLSFLVTVSIGIGGMAYAANSGGQFGQMLNRILVSGNWQTDTTGVVKNSAKLGGNTPESFVKLSTNPNDLKCNTNQCMYGIDSSGKAMCR